MREAHCSERSKTHHAATGCFFGVDTGISRLDDEVCWKPTRWVLRFSVHRQASAARSRSALLGMRRQAIGQDSSADSTNGKAVEQPHPPICIPCLISRTREMEDYGAYAQPQPCESWTRGRSTHTQDDTPGKIIYMLPWTTFLATLPAVTICSKLRSDLQRSCRHHQATGLHKSTGDLIGFHISLVTQPGPALLQTISYPIARCLGSTAIVSRM